MNVTKITLLTIRAAWKHGSPRGTTHNDANKEMFRNIAWQKKYLASLAAQRGRVQKSWNCLRAFLVVILNGFNVPRLGSL